MKINKYLKRIKVKVDPKVDLQTLTLLQKAHLLNIPFENLDIHNNTEIRLDINRIFTKVITNGRGGFCYELNGLFYELLLRIGFEAKLITCRVYKAEKGYGLEHAHMAIIVALDDGEYLCDVGFGAFAMGPLALNMGTLQQDLKGVFVIEKYEDEYFRVSKLKDDQATPEYIFKKKAMTYTDFVEMCHYTQTSPDSHFTQKKIISRPTLTGRISLSAKTLKITVGNNSTAYPLLNKVDFDNKLWEYFNIRR